MRVITGTARGTKLKTPEGMLTRPTTDRVKEALFNIIQFDIAGDVLDLFAGTGQLGIEALSRGASRAVFVDHRQDAAALVRENLRRTHFEDRGEVVCTDFTQYLARCRRKFRLIFLYFRYCPLQHSFFKKIICIQKGKIFPLCST